MNLLRGPHPSQWQDIIANLNVPTKRATCTRQPDKHIQDEQKEFLNIPYMLVEPGKNKHLTYTFIALLILSTMTAAPAGTYTEYSSQYRWRSPIQPIR